MSVHNEPEMPYVIDYSDYEEKSIKEMLEDSVLIQLIIMFVQIAMLIGKILLSLVRDIIDGIFLTLKRIFDEEGELMIMLEYAVPFVYYMKTD